MKQRLGYSPDDADAFALTFAQPAVKTRGRWHDEREQPKPGWCLVDYNPFAGVR